MSKLVQAIATTGYGQRMAKPGYPARVAEAGILLGRAVNGDRLAMVQLKEAMSTSDFPILLGDFMLRQLARQYAARPAEWRGFAAKTTVKDFRVSKLVDLVGGAGLLPRVAELAPYEARKLAETPIDLKTEKHGARIMWSWEMQINDDLSALTRAPGQLAVAATSTEDHSVISALTTATGPAAWLGTPLSGAGSALSATSLGDALQTIRDAKDSDGNPINVGTPVLVVPPALETAAQQIVNTIETRQTTGSTERIVRGNGLPLVPKIASSSWLTTVDESANADTTWYLLPDPEGPRPGLYGVFLAGHEDPDLRVKNDQGSRPGGGDVGIDEGSFENDSVQWRLRHIVAGARGFDDAVFVSLGNG